MSEGFAVDIGQLRKHAARISDIQGQSAEAVDAGNQVTPGGWDNAYGVICQSFPALLRPTAQKGIDALGQVTDALQAQSDQVNEAADRYEDINKQIVEVLKRILAALERLETKTVGGHR